MTEEPRKDRRFPKGLGGVLLALLAFLLVVGACFSSAQGDDCTGENQGAPARVEERTRRP